MKSIVALGLVLTVCAFAQKERDIIVTKKTDQPLTVRPDGIPRSYALVVGVAEYQNLSRDHWLQYSERDAESMYSVLISPKGGSYKAENVHKLVGAKATVANLRHEIESWLPSVAQDADRVLIYFAGHGFVHQGKAYLAPYDFDRTRVSDTGYSMDTLGHVISAKIRAKWKVLFTDACHSGAISQDTMTINSALHDLSRSLFSLTASRDRELSFEAQTWGGGHGVFTYYLIQGLEGAADETGDGVVTADELAEYVHYNVRESVRKLNSALQSPTFDRSSFDPNMPLSFPGITERHDGQKAKYGTLLFTSSMDGIEVYVDDELKGTLNKDTPLSISGLTVGNHTVKGVKLGYEPDGPREETVYPNQTSTVTIKILYPRRRDKRSTQLLEDGIKEYNKARYEKAADDFRRALEIDTKYSQAALYLARAYRGLSDIENAQKYFRRALEIDPDYLEAAWSYGGMLLDKGDVDEAIRQLNSVVQRDPKHGNAFYLLAQAFRMKELYEQAIEASRKSIAVSPNNPEAHFFLAESLKMSKQCPLAGKEYLEYLKLSDFDSKLAGKLNYYVGGYLLGMGRKKRAAQPDVWKELRSLAYAGLGDCERVTSHPDAAIAYYKQSLSYANEPMVHFAMGEAFTSKAELTQDPESLPSALIHFREMLKINPDLSEAALAKKYIVSIEGLLQAQNR